MKSQDGKQPNWWRHVTVCKTPIALPPYGKVTASSERSNEKGNSCQADDGYIITNKAWCAKQDDGEWVRKEALITAAFYFKRSALPKCGALKNKCGVWNSGNVALAKWYHLLHILFWTWTQHRHYIKREI